MKHIKYQTDTDGIAYITWDVANSAVNILNTETLSEFFTQVNQALADDKVKGVVINSAKQDFISGGDLKWFLNYNQSKTECFDMLMQTNHMFRKIETGGKPFVAAINGMALGGGLELALACHHRIMAAHPKNKVGLVECSVGLFPGAGGTQRFLRMLGPKKTIEYITQSKTFKAEHALNEGIIDQLAQPTDNINAMAKQWILTNGNTQQPWDDKRFLVPGTPVGMGQISGVTEFFSVGNAMAYKTTHGNMPHIKNVLSAIYHGATCDIDNALEIEARYFTDTLFTKETKNIIRSSFVFINEAAKGKTKPQGFDKASYTKIGVVGAGMMGAGIAYVSAQAGLEVVLKDISTENAEKGKDYSRKLLNKQIEKGRTTAQNADAILNKIFPTDKSNDLVDCDLIIEAVFENEKLKNTVTQEVENVIDKHIIFASNTSTIPITSLAKASARPDKFIGLHFFSPVDKMPLVEIIKGAETTEETLAKAIDFVIKIRKVPIVVNDGRGFFTSRVFTKYVNEGITLLAEGVPPAVIENVARKIGMPVGPLAVSDEVNLKLMLDIMSQNPNLTDDEKALQNTINTIVEIHQRTGKKEGRGFYEYPQKARKYLWPEWNTIFEQQPSFDEEEIGRRMLFAMVIEAYKCLDTGIIQQPKDADVGSILGLGFPIYTGGVMAYIDYVGAEKFAQYSKKLTQKYGQRFQMPASLKNKIEQAQTGRIFYTN